MRMGMSDERSRSRRSILLLSKLQLKSRFSEMKIFAVFEKLDRRSGRKRSRPHSAKDLLVLTVPITNRLETPSSNHHHLLHLLRITTERNFAGQPDKGGIRESRSHMA